MKISWANSGGLAAALQVKTTPGRLYYVVGLNTKATTQYILVFDTASTPTGTDVPVLTLNANARFDFFWDYHRIPRPFVNGIYICNSSQADALVAGAADCLFDVGYV